MNAKPFVAYLSCFWALCLSVAMAQNTRYYFYNDGGALIATIEPDGSTIRYNFDQAGNRTALSVAKATQSGITDVIPDEISAGHTYSVAIVGKDLDSATGVSFGTPGMVAVITGIKADTFIQVTLSIDATVSAGNYPFEVQRSTGEPIDSGEISLEVLGGPALTNIAPSEVLQGQTLQNWVLTGSRLSDTTAILFDSPGLSATNLSTSTDGILLTAQLTVGRTVPIGTTGVRVQTNAGISNRAHLQIKPGYQFIQYGETVSGGIDRQGEVDTYAFDGTAGDQIIVRMSQPGSALGLKLRVFRPDGTLLCSGQAFPALEISCTLNVTGAHTILAEDNGGTHTGGYGLYLQRTNNPGGATPINFGNTLAATIGAIAEGDTYSFSGSSGDHVIVRVSQPGSSLGPRLRVFRPDGTLLCTGQAFPAFEISCTLDATGPHAILAEDNGGAHTGSYGLYLQRTNNPGGATPINFGNTLAATVGAIAEGDTYSFSGSSSDHVIVRMSQPGSALGPRLRIFRPDGTLLCSGQAFPALEISCTLDVTGLHFIFVEDNGGAHTGSYGLYLQRTNNPGGATPINFGNTLAATIGAIAEGDTYSFSGSLGDHVIVRMSQPGSALGPRLRVFRPDGTLLCSGQAFPALEISCTLDVTGLHFIFVEDNGGAHIGSYGLYIQRTNNPDGATSINFGDTIGATIGAIAEGDTYSFNGLTSDHIIVRMTQPGSALGPKLRVFRPDGTLLCSGQAFPTLEISCTLDVTGNHAIFAEDNGGSHTGSYSLQLQH